MATTGQKIAYNVTFSSAARILDTVLALVITAMLTRYLGRTGFGDYIIVFTFWYIFTVLADMGLYAITVREISQREENESEIASNAFTLRMASAAIIFFAAVLILYFLPYSNYIKLGVIIAAPGFWALFGGQVLMGIFQKNIRIDRAALAEMAGRIVQFALVFVFIKKELGFLSIIAAFSVSGAVNLLFNFWFAKKFVKLRLANDYAIWKKMIREGFPLAVSAILTMLYFRLNVITLSFLKDAEAVGIFGVGYKILENVIFFPAMFVGLVMPMMSRSAKDDMEKFKSILQRSLSAMIVFIFPLIVFTIILSDKIVYIIGGTNFTESASVLSILIFAAALIFLGTLWSNAIIALNKQKQLVKIYFWGAVLNIIANFVLIPSLSYDGAAWSTLATEFLVTLMMAFYLWKEIGYMPRVSRVLKLGGAIIVAALGVIFMERILAGSSPFIQVAVCLPIGVVLYFSILYFIGGLKKEEFGMFLKKNSSV